MKMTIEQCEDTIIRIILDGRLDMAGTQDIEQRFAFATSTRAMRLVIDLSRVSFMASIGIRALVAAAKAQAARGGMMAIVQPEPMVRRVLETAGIHHLIPLYEDFQAAHAALRP
jgi:anti-anti-sigma factor